MAQRRRMPADTYVELSAELIDEGKFIAEITSSCREAHAALVKRKERGEFGGECTVNATVRMGYDPDVKGLINVTTCVVLKTPKNEHTTLVKETGGMMLCQLDGSSAETPDQLRLFDSKARPIGTLDKHTGEVAPVEEIAGRVGAA